MATNQLVQFKMLDVSTAHLSPETRRRLESSDIDGVLYYPKGPWGWFVNVPSPEDEPTAEVEVPADLKVCINFAQATQHEWIMFDCDGSIVQELQHFDDGTKSPTVESNALHQDTA